MPRFLQGVKHFLSLTAIGGGIIIFLILVTNAAIVFATHGYIYKNAAEAPAAQAALIPGAAILRNGGLSPIFKDRVDMAIELYKAKKVHKILISGDNSTVSYNEVNPVRDYLLAKGMPDEDIFLDHAGFDTYSTMYRARDIFHVTSTLITTQSFHLPRAVYIARNLGINAMGVVSDKGHSLFSNYVREVLADEKAMIDLLTRRKPKFLGPEIPITGDGRNYP